MTNKVLCVFHSPCLDGFASAWVVGYRLGFDNVEFVGVKYGDPVPDMTDREVYIVDFSYPPAILIPAAKTAKSITVLDHHKTAKDQWAPVPLDEAAHEMLMKLHPDSNGVFYRAGASSLPEDPEIIGVKLAPMPSNLEVVFSDIRAGVGTVWDRFFLGQDFPIVLNAIDCGDRWKMDESVRVRDVCEYCRGLGYLRVTPEKLASFSGLIGDTNSLPSKWMKYHEIADQGNAIAAAYDNLINEIVPFNNPRMVRLAGFDVPCHAVPDFFKSSVGNRFDKEYPFSITYDDNLVLGHRKFSLRSDQEKGVNVEVIAKAFGGGGHVSAAGFIIPFERAAIGSSIQDMLDAQYFVLYGRSMRDGLYHPD
jgi:hypothetical protein